MGVSGPVETDPEGQAGPSIVPGPRGCLQEDGRETATRGTRAMAEIRAEILITNGNRVGGIPGALRLGRAVSVSTEEREIVTNSDVKESPSWETCSRRDRVGEPADRRQ